MLMPLRMQFHGVHVASWGWMRLKSDVGKEELEAQGKNSGNTKPTKTLDK